MSKKQNIPNPETVKAAVQHTLKLEKQGKPLSEALSHARHRYGVSQAALRREVSRVS